MRSSATAKRRPRANRGKWLRDYRHNLIFFNYAPTRPRRRLPPTAGKWENLCVASLGRKASNGVTNHGFNNPVGWDRASPLEPMDAFNISVPACRD